MTQGIDGQMQWCTQDTAAYPHAERRNTHRSAVVLFHPDSNRRPWDHTKSADL